MAERAHPDHPGFQDKWFGLKKNKYRAQLFQRYEFCLPYLKDQVVVDVPCGSGWGTSLLKGYDKLHGVDISEEAVTFAKERFGGTRGLDFRLGNMAELPFSADYADVIICLEGFEHVDRDTGSRFLLEAKRVLKPGGLLLLTCPVLNDYGEDSGNPYHLCEYPEQELIALFNDEFRLRLLERFVGPDGPAYRIVAETLSPSGRYQNR
jgi:ubiquinone/menaquinone biosynthesis C-methylase UbiE